MLPLLLGLLLRLIMLMHQGQLGNRDASELANGGEQCALCVA